MIPPPELTADKFRLLTWPRPELSRMTIQSEVLEKHCPLDSGRLERRIVAPSSTQAELFDSGNLTTLPLEMKHLILRLLDLKPLTNLRAVSWGARTLVDNLPQYKAIIEHAPNALRAFLSTNMAVQLTSTNLFDTLCTQACFCCGQFGPMLDLFTCNRCCTPCASDSNDLLSITVAIANMISS